MMPKQVLGQLQESVIHCSNNIDLLKKLILTARLGRLRVNGLPPDNKVSLGQYLFEHESTTFDFTRLNEEKRKVFNQWLLEPHEKDKISIYSQLLKKNAAYWNIVDLSSPFAYQLSGIELCLEKQCLIVGFHRVLADSKALQPNPLSSTKIVFISNQLVDHLLESTLHNPSFEILCQKSHPQSINVINMQDRQELMFEYQKNYFLALHPWRKALDWFPWFRQGNKIKNNSVVDTPKIVLYQSDTMQMELFMNTFAVLVKEKKPEIDNIVYCGGGAKIFSHVGFWKALNEAHIYPAKFSGSSSGAIMALLCYLGYTADEIFDLFNTFKQEHLLHFDIRLNGMSNPQSLKTAIDYAIAYKIEQITTRYKIPYPDGQITFATLEALRQQCPDCGVGKELIVTATNKNLGITRYFSLKHSPSFELSEAVKISSSLPIIYYPTLINGEEHIDGGILTNFPTEVFDDDHTTLLESEYGNNLKVLAVQFDNGTERSAIDRIRDKVYKENFFINGAYRMLTGVRDPASGWEQDRLKLRRYSSQSIVINVNNVSSTSFSVNEENKRKMIQTGYDATMNYLNIRYIKDDYGNYMNDELLYNKFYSLSDLLSYCCYRGNYYWFRKVSDLISEANVPNKKDLLTQVEELSTLYFANINKKENTHDTNNNAFTFFGNQPSAEQPVSIKAENHKILVAIYPVFLKLLPELLRDSKDKKLFDDARHSLTLSSPFACLKHFVKIQNPINILLHVIINLLKEFEKNSSQVLFNGFKAVAYVLKNNQTIYKEEYYAKWNLSFAQSMRVLRLLNNNKPILSLLHLLSKGEEPLQTVVAGEYCDEDRDDNDEENESSSIMIP